MHEARKRSEVTPKLPEDLTCRRLRFPNEILFLNRSAANPTLKCAQKAHSAAVSCLVLCSLSPVDPPPHSSLQLLFSLSDSQISQLHPPTMTPCYPYLPPRLRPPQGKAYSSPALCAFLQPLPPSHPTTAPPTPTPHPVFVCERPEKGARRGRQDLERDHVDQM